MFDGLLADTCYLVADKIRLDQYGERALAYDLVEYGCLGENRVEIRRQRFEGQPGDSYVIQKAILERVVADVNTRLRGRRHCGCVRGSKR